MARYSRSRDSPNNPKKVNKQQKLEYWLSKPAEYSNQLELIACEDDEIEENDTQKSLSQSKPPPIYVSKVENIQPLKILLKEIASNQYELKLLRENEIKIQPKTIES